MRTLKQFIVIATLFFAGSAQASDALRENVIYFLERAPVTAHIKIDNVSTLEEFRSNKTENSGYKKFKVTATVVEGFKGIEPGKIEFTVTQEHPSIPPNKGEFIVSLILDRDDNLVFADSSVLWVPAKPDLIAAARAARELTIRSSRARFAAERCGRLYRNARPLRRPA